MRFYLSLFAVILAISVATISAQEKNVSVKAYFYDRQNEPTPVELPLPVFPEIAKKAGLGGYISLGVTIDETGKVASIDNILGPQPYCYNFKDPQLDALREAASTAALASRFKPSIVDGRAVSVKGQLNYEFPVVSISGPDTTVIGSSDTGVRVVTTTDSSSSEVIRSLPKMISGGVLNGKAIVLAKPTYPPAALAVRASGAVSVQVVISEDGTMRSASAVSGHPLLRSVSEIAACSSKFPPTLLSGQPVKVSGVITYNFNL